MWGKASFSKDRLYKPDQLIHYANEHHPYGSHVYRLGDKFVARRGGKLRVVRLTAEKPAYWEETDEIVEVKDEKS